MVLCTDGAQCAQVGKQTFRIDAGMARLLDDELTYQDRRTSVDPVDGVAAAALFAVALGTPSPATLEFWPDVAARSP
jgi:hypothetical protein